MLAETDQFLHHFFVDIDDGMVNNNVTMIDGLSRTLLLLSGLARP